MGQTLKRVSRKIEDQGSSQKWLLSYGDSMTNLMTFFVLLVSFSSFDDKQFRKVSNSFTNALPSLRVSKVRSPKEAVVPPRNTADELNKGSERLSLEGNVAGYIQEQMAFKDFENKKVFLVRSERIFWGDGTMLTETGGAMLKDISLLLAAISNKVVVSEYATDPGTASRANGLARAWAVANYIAGQKDIPLDRLAVSDTGMIRPDDLPLELKAGKRVLEIVVLERSLAR